MDPTARPVPRMVPVEKSPSLPKESPDLSAAWKAGFVAVFRAAAAILAVRILLFLTGAGGFVLALLALRSNAILPLVAVAIYAVGIFLPCVVLGLKGR